MAIYGSQVTTCVLCPDKVREIRAARAAGESCRAIGRRYGVSDVQVSRIDRRVFWKWVD